MIIAAVAAVLPLICTPLPTCGGAVTVNCATPTPVVGWHEVDDYALAGYRLYVRDNGDPLVRVADLPCEWDDIDEDGVLETRICRGADFYVPVQRHCATCAPMNLYEFAVKAYDLLGRESVAYSNAIAICMPPVYDIAAHGVYQ